MAPTPLLLVALVALSWPTLTWPAATPGPIHVGIIAETSPKTDQRHHVLGHSHAMQFIQRIFADISVDHKVAERKIWPPVFTGQCPGVVFKDNTAFNKVHAPGFTRGLILAHRQIWDEFAWQHKDAPNGTLYESPKLVVFEDDAMEIDPRYVIGDVGTGQDH
jgi:hypothetical protein